MNTTKKETVHRMNKDHSSMLPSQRRKHATNFTGGVLLLQFNKLPPRVVRGGAIRKGSWLLLFCKFSDDGLGLNVSLTAVPNFAGYDTA
jgi:hypothetical protein